LLRLYQTTLDRHCKRPLNRTAVSRALPSRHVAKRERDPDRPSERGWVKTKNRATARFAQELEGARSARRRSLVTR
jgi:hypothetical protein